MKVNTHAKMNLPKPEFFPVHSVSNDPTIYETTLTQHCGFTTKKKAAFEKLSHPFGSLP